jgi:hypothetical protein
MNESIPYHQQGEYKAEDDPFDLLQLNRTGEMPIAIELGVHRSGEHTALRQ